MPEANDAERLVILLLDFHALPDVKVIWELMTDGDGFDHAREIVFIRIGRKRQYRLPGGTLSAFQCFTLQ